MTLTYDPCDFSIDADPWALWGRMREEAPLYRNEERNFYALSRFEDVFTALTDYRTYSSRRGNLLEVIELRDDQRPRFLSFMDPPDHQFLRRTVSKGFSPAAIGALRLRVRELASAYLDRLGDRPQFDFVGDFARYLPVAVIAELMGIPEEAHDRMRLWVDAHTVRRAGQTGYEHDALNEMRSYIAELSAERRERPKDDLLSVISRATIQGPRGRRSLEPDEILDVTVQLAAAGSETTVRLMGWIVRLLAQHPGEAMKLRRSPELAQGALEEVLRFEPPLVRQARLVTADVEWHGQTVPAGARLLLLIGAASRDPREFERPDEFRIDRTIPRSLAFSAGVHHCLGASLARLEGVAFLQEWLRRVDSWDVDEAGLEFAYSSFNRGYGRMPVEVRWNRTANASRSLGGPA